MKYLITLVFALGFFSCQSDKKNPSTDLELDDKSTDLYDPIESEQSSEDQNYQAALDFLNSYIENNHDIDIIEFVNSSTLATESLKRELTKMITQAREEDSIVGLGFDPLFDAQDYPNKGVELHSFNPETGYVMVKGIDWEDFRVAMRVVNENGHILVDGCGVVNIPEDKRAER